MIASRRRRVGHSLAGLSAVIYVNDRPDVQDLRRSRGLVGDGWLVSFEEGRWSARVTGRVSSSSSIDYRSIASSGRSDARLVRRALSVVRLPPESNYTQELASGSYFWRSDEPNSGELTLTIESAPEAWVLARQPVLRVHVRAGDSYSFSNWGDVHVSWCPVSVVFPSREMLSEIGALNHALLF